MEWSGNGTKQAEIMQKIFPHFFVYSLPISEAWTAQKRLIRYNYIIFAKMM